MRRCTENRSSLFCCAERGAASAALRLFAPRYDLFAGLMTNIKKDERKVKKGVDKRRSAWYSNQAVADEAGREMKNTEF